VYESFRQRCRDMALLIARKSGRVEPSGDAS